MDLHMGLVITWKQIDSQKINHGSKWIQLKIAFKV